MESLHIVIFVTIAIVVAIILIYCLILKPRKGVDADDAIAATNSYVSFCIGTYVNTKYEFKKAIGAKLSGTSVYYCVKNTVHNLNYDFSDEQVKKFKDKFAGCRTVDDFKNLVYYTGAAIVPLKENI